MTGVKNQTLGNTDSHMDSIASPLDNGSANFFCHGPDSTLDFANHNISVGTTQL